MATQASIHIKPTTLEPTHRPVSRRRDCQPALAAAQDGTPRPALGPQDGDPMMVTDVDKAAQEAVEASRVVVVEAPTRRRRRRPAPL